MGETAEEGVIPGVRSLGCGGVAAVAPVDPEQRVSRGPGRFTPTHPPTPRGGPNFPGLFLEMSGVAPVPGRGVPGWVFK